MRIQSLMASVVIVFLSSAPAISGGPGLILSGNGQDSVAWWDPTGNAPPPIIIAADSPTHVIDNQ